MNTYITKQDTTTLITLDGSLDTVNSNLFMTNISELLNQTNLNIVIDCQALTYISSSGLRTFKLIQKSVNENNGKLVVSRVRPEVKKIFELTGFTKILTIED